jgi:hypothetical protein
MNFLPRFTFKHAITLAHPKIERTLGFLKAAKLTEGWISMKQKRAFVLRPAARRHFEGTQLTLEELRIYKPARRSPFRQKSSDEGQDQLRLLAR